MSAITLETARNVAVVGVIVFVVLAVGAAILLKSIAQKLALVAIFGLLALMVWTQRSSLDACADAVREQVSPAEATEDIVCTFFGRDIVVRSADGA